MGDFSTGSLGKRESETTEIATVLMFVLSLECIDRVINKRLDQVPTQLI